MNELSAAGSRHGGDEDPDQPETKEPDYDNVEELCPWTVDAVMRKYFFKTLAECGQKMNHPKIVALLNYTPEHKKCKTCTNVTTEMSRVGLGRTPPINEYVLWGWVPRFFGQSQKTKTAIFYTQGTLCQACVRIFNHDYRATLKNRVAFEAYISSTNDIAETHQKKVTALEDYWVDNEDEDAKIDWSWVASRSLELTTTQKVQVKHPGFHFCPWTQYITKENTTGVLRDGEFRAPGLDGVTDGVWMTQHITKISFSEEVAAHLRTHLQTGSSDAGSVCNKKGRHTHTHTIIHTYKACLPTSRWAL